MGPALAQTGLRADCDRKSPGSAGHIFQKHHIDSEAVKQQFADCGGVACLAGNAYYNPDLHTAPWLAERLFKAGKYDMCVPSPMRRHLQFVASVPSLLALAGTHLCNCNCHVANLHAADSSTMHVQACGAAGDGDELRRGRRLSQGRLHVGRLVAICQVRM